MKVDQVREWVNKNTLHPQSVVIGDDLHPDDDRLCISFSAVKWEVYYAERGGKVSLRIFENEHDACEYFMSWIKSSKTLFVPHFNKAGKRLPDRLTRETEGQIGNKGFA